MVDEGRGRFRVDVRLDGALYRMVRNMVGTAFLVGRGGLDMEEAARALEVVYDNGGRPTRAAPAHGLTLEYVYYDDY